MRERENVSYNLIVWKEIMIMRVGEEERKAGKIVMIYIFSLMLFGKDK